jgi:hypothetical protein
VHVVGARGLPRMDRFGRGGADPFVALSLDRATARRIESGSLSAEGTEGLETRQTAVIKVRAG